MHTISSYCGNRPTKPQTHKQTNRQDWLQYTVSLASAQCKKVHMIKAFNKTQTKFKAEAHTCSSDNLARITHTNVSLTQTTHREYRYVVKWKHIKHWLLFNCWCHPMNLSWRLIILSRWTTSVQQSTCWVLNIVISSFPLDSFVQR